MIASASDKIIARARSGHCYPAPAHSAEKPYAHEGKPQPQRQIHQLRNVAVRILMHQQSGLGKQMNAEIINWIIIHLPHTPSTTSVTISPAKSLGSVR